MNASTEKFAAAGKANVETMLVIANTAFASAERLAALNLNTARTLLEETVASTKAVLSMKNPQDLLAFQKSLAMPAIEKAVAYSKSVYEITSQTQEVFGALFEGKAAEMKVEFDATLEKVAKNAPAGSEVALRAVKSAIASANSTIETMQKSAKQAVEMAEANVSAATSATLKTLKSAA